VPAAESWPRAHDVTAASRSPGESPAPGVETTPLDITFRFSPTVVLLTGVHFHYAGFVLAIATVAVLVLERLAPAVERIPGALLAVASLSLLVTMSLALAYADSVFPATGTLVAIPEMIR